MKKFWLGIFVAMASSAFATVAMSDNYDGGGCDFYDIHGRAVILSIEKAQSDAYNCGDDAVEILAKFVPDNPELDVPGTNNLTIIDFTNGMNPPHAWVEDNNLSVGSEIRGVKSVNRYFYPEIGLRVCAPIIFTDWQIELDPHKYQCWE